MLEAPLRRRVRVPVSSAAGRTAALEAIENWIAGHVELADPLQWATPVEAAFRRKCFAELSFVVTMAQAIGGEATVEPGSALGRIRHYVLRSVGDDLISLAHRSADRTSIFAFPMALAVRSQHLAPGQVGRVRELLESRLAWGIERLPYRFLELATACTMAGARPQLPIDLLLATSSLAIPPDPFTAPKDALYALTHAVFYAYLLKGTFVEADALLQGSLKGAMCRALADQDLDLGLELAIAARLCGMGGGPVEDAMLDRATATILEVGILDAEFSAASAPFAAAIPQQAVWARSIHLMQVAAVAMRASDLLPSGGRRTYANRLETEEAIGAVILAVQRYDLKGAADRMVGLQTVPVDPDQKQLLYTAARHILSTRRPDGGFGHLGDDKRAFELLRPCEDFGATRAASIDAACRSALEHYCPEIGMRPSDPILRINH